MPVCQKPDIDRKNVGSTAVCRNNMKLLNTMYQRAHGRLGNTNTSLYY